MALGFSECGAAMAWGLSGCGDISAAGFTGCHCLNVHEEIFLWFYQIINHGIIF